MKCAEEKEYQTPIERGKFGVKKMEITGRWYNITS